MKPMHYIELFLYLIHCSSTTIILITSLSKASELNGLGISGIRNTSWESMVIPYRKVKKKKKIEQGNIKIFIGLKNVQKNAY